MKLLYTLTSYPPAIGGAQLHLHLLAQQFQAQHKIQVVSQWENQRTDWLLGTTLFAPTKSHNYTIDEIQVHRLGLSVWEKSCLAPFVPLYYPLMQVALPPIATCLERHLYPYAKDADLVHNVRAGREGLSYASWQVAQQRKIPFVFTPVHHPRWVGWRYKAFLKLYTLADLVIALTKAEKEVLIDLGVAEERIAVTGMGPVLAEKAVPRAFLQTYQLEEGPVVLFVGQNYRYKGYRELLQATRLVWKKLPEVNFVFIGPTVGSSSRDFAAFADRRIRHLGCVSLQEKTNALAACTLLCVPSTQESFGGVYPEAWSFAKPVIGCNIPAVTEVISEGVDGYLVAQKAEAIAERICYLLQNPTLATKMGLAGQQKVAERYTWQQIATLTAEAYQNVLG